MFSVGFKVFNSNYAPDMVIPLSGYKVEISMAVACQEGEAQIISALPASNFRQSIFDLKENAGAFDYASISRDGNRFGRWQASGISGNQEVSYAFSVKAQKVVYQLPDSLPCAVPYPDTLARFLTGPDFVQTNNATAQKVLGELQLGKSNNLLTEVEKVYDFTAHGMEAFDFAGMINPPAPLQTGEADSNSKNQLFVALLQALGVPARLVSGLVLSSDKDAFVHHWAEAFLGNQWVSFDPAQQLYAVLPANYIVFCRGAGPFFQHTENTSLDYTIKSGRHLFFKESDLSALAGCAGNIMTVWPYFERAGVPLDLLRMILMIPVGAIVTIIFRNVIGVEIFGTFLPVLIASAFRETGLFWGLLIFVTIILTGAVLGAVLRRLRILYAPRLTIVLVYVVAALFLASIVSMKFANVSLGNATLFPLAVMAITIERFSLLVDETGVKKALTLLANTVITVVFCHLVIDSLFLQAMVLAFPETMLLVIGASIYLGSWKGLRLNELLRFRGLIFNK